MLSLIRAHLTGRELLLVSAFALTLLLACLRPDFGQPAFRKVEAWASSLSRRKALAILVLGTLPVVIRLSLLPLMPVPVPQVHDEFSYLLAADTFAHGRLTNPPHAMSIFLDTIQVNQRPTYMSKYPPAQGFVLAFGQVTTGYPWAGVLLSVGAMCAVALWMLQGWLPEPWALLGATLLLLRVGIFSYWMNSYWGGAVPALGGALVLGALPRIMKSHRTADSLWMGLGAAILAQSRPLEGLVLCAPVGVCLAMWVLGRRSPSLRVTFPRVVAPCGLLVLLTVGFVAYYNLRLTGSMFEMPYAVNEQTYWSTPTLLWQKVRPPIHFANAQFDAFYNGWARTEWLQTENSTAKRAVSVVVKLVYFFCWPELCIPLLAMVLLLRDGRTRFLLIEVAVCFAGFLAVAWFQPHYAAPVSTALFALLTQSLRHLNRCKVRGRPLGVGLTRVAVLYSILLAPLHPHGVTFREPSKADVRAKIDAQLEASPGQHLVIVRYPTDGHDPLLEWVYNKADIDTAKVVWVREIPGQNLDGLFAYFANRERWLVEPDTAHPYLMPFGPR